MFVNTHAYGIGSGALAGACICAGSPVRPAVRALHGELRARLGMRADEQTVHEASARGSGVAVGRRIDYLDDPDAPAANSLVPSVNVAVVNDGGRGAADPADRQRQLGAAGRRDGQWRDDRRRRRSRDPGGDRGSSARSSGSSGIYTNPRHVILYTSNGEVRQECSFVFTARASRREPDAEQRVVGGSMGRRRISSSAYTMHPSMRQRVEHFLEGSATNRTSGEPRPLPVADRPA